MSTSRAYHLKRHFVGVPEEDDFFVKESKIPPLADGEYLLENLYLSVDPYMRIYASNIKVGDPMFGLGVGRVILSKDDNFPVGTLVVGPVGWSTHHVPLRSAQYQRPHPLYHKLPSYVDHMSHVLGVLGQVGLSAYYGFLDICEPKKGESVFVNTAAGAVGSIVGQIAKIKECHVVGCAGSDTKVDYLKEIGFDHAFNYKTENVDAKLKEYFPKGIDCFFDNVGGEMFDTTLTHMNRYGRVSLCGSMSMYNKQKEDIPKGTYIHMEALPRELKIQGFVSSSFKSKSEEAFKQLNEWIKEGKLQVREHVVEGFENTPKAFIGLFQGENIGKVVVKVKWSLK